MKKSFEVVIPQEVADLAEMLLEFVPGDYYTQHIKRLQAAEIICTARTCGNSPVTDYDITKYCSAGKAVRDSSMRLGVSLGLFEEVEYKGKTAWVLSDTQGIKSKP